jgi:hypothetical protein
MPTPPVFSIDPIVFYTLPAPLSSIFGICSQGMKSFNIFISSMASGLQRYKKIVFNLTGKGDMSVN